MHCPSWDDAFVSVFVCLFVCLSRFESGAPCVRGVHSLNKHCVAVYCPISTRFTAFFFRIDCSLCFLRLAYKSRRRTNRHRCTLIRRVLLIFQAVIQENNRYKCFTASAAADVDARGFARLGGCSSWRDSEVCGLCTLNLESSGCVNT